MGSTPKQLAGASLARSERDHALTAVLRALKVDGLL
jgi:hypothetical protein